MGAVYSSLDIRLIEYLRGAVPLNVLVETGSYKGDTVAAAVGRFQRIYSVEQSEELHAAVSARFRREQAVTIIHGDSAPALGKLRPELGGESVFYWLDAHWCAGEDTAGSGSQCPLLGELGAIGTLNAESVIAIDDARLFLCPPTRPHDASQWPRFDDVLAALAGLSRAHRLMVVNDVILYFPAAVVDGAEKYAIERGVDWNQIVRVSSGGIDTIAELEAKENTIRRQHEVLAGHRLAIRRLKRLLAECHAVQDQSSAALRVIRRMYSAVRIRITQLGWGR